MSTTTNRGIFSDLHFKQKSNPTASNLDYLSHVQAWLWSHLEDRNQECQILIDWVKKKSCTYSEYAKKIYSKTPSAHNILSGSKHRSWLDTQIEFPANVNCPCTGCQPKDENMEVKNILVYHNPKVLMYHSIYNFNC